MLARLLHPSAVAATAVHPASFLDATHALVRASSLACLSGSAFSLRRLLFLLRRTASARHASEQYLAVLWVVANALPHIPHFTRRTRATILSALAAQRLQWAWYVPPYVAKRPPHSLHSADRTGAAARGARPAARPACCRVRRGFRRPSPSLPSLALRLATRALCCATKTARLCGSARYRRMYSRSLRRLPSTRHAGEQYRALLLPANLLPHSPHSTSGLLAIALSALVEHRLQ